MLLARVFNPHNTLCFYPFPQFCSFSLRMFVHVVS